MRWVEREEGGKRKDMGGERRREGKVRRGQRKKNVFLCLRWWDPAVMLHRSEAIWICLLLVYLGGVFPPLFIMESSSAKSRHVGNIHLDVTEERLLHVFRQAGPVLKSNLVRKDGYAIAFVEYPNHAIAARAMTSLDGSRLGPWDIHVAWQHRNPRVLTEAKFNDNPLCRTVYVGHLPEEVTVPTLFEFFDDMHVGEIDDVQKMVGQEYGFVVFYTHDQAAEAITRAHGRVMLGKTIKCSWSKEHLPIRVPGSEPIPHGLWLTIN